jgi:Uma2 family endonuclease
MRTGTTKRLFTVDDLYRMDKAGIFTNERVELIRGEVFVMTIGSRHAARVERARDLFNRLLSGKVAVRSQNPVWIDDYNLPQPDVIVTKPRDDYYELQHPRVEDTFFLLEVSDSSLEHDREVKLAVYAISNIREYWIENISEDALLVFRDPESDHYATCLTLRRGDTRSPLAFPDVQIKVEDLLG